MPTSTKLFIFATLIWLSMLGARADDDSVENFASDILAPFDSNFPVRMINGLETVRKSPFELILNRGSATDVSGQHLIQIQRPISLDIRVIGQQGRDDATSIFDVQSMSSSLARNAVTGYRATYAKNHKFSGLPLRGWYSVVVVGSKNVSGSAILTRRETISRINRPTDAVVPKEFSFRRQTPAAHFFDPSQGFRPMVCAGWPQPTCNWTRLRNANEFNILRKGIRTSATLLDVSDWLPPHGRIIKLQAVVTSISGRAGGAYLQSTQNSEGSFLVGKVGGFPGSTFVTFIELSATSKRTIAYRVDDGIELDLYAVGFTILEPR